MGEKLMLSSLLTFELVNYISSSELTEQRSYTNIRILNLQTDRLVVQLSEHLENQSFQPGQLRYSHIMWL